MKAGLVGLPGAGKSTLFQAITRSDGSGDPFRVVDVPDPRIDRLVEIFSPRKTSYAKFDCHDFAGIGGDARTQTRLMADMRDLDALAIVVRGFESQVYPYEDGSVDPARDLENVISAFQIADYLQVETRVEKLRVSTRKPTKNREQEIVELAVLERLHKVLDEGGRIEDVSLSEKEEMILRGFRFLTQKPSLVILDLPDDGAGEDELRAAIPDSFSKVLPLRGGLEASIAELDEEDAQLFMSEYGIEKPARDLLIASLYDLLGLQSFLTAGEDECRAWTLRKGATALEAAGAIHSDIQRGFIRAEVVAYDDLIAAGGLKEAKAQKLMRLEGKEYEVKDGEIVHFRFNV